MEPDPRTNVLYISTGPFPLYCGLALSEKAFLKEMKRMAVDDPPPFITPGAGATMHTFERPSECVCIIALDAQDSIKKRRTATQVYGLLVHECVHVWQECRKQMGEEAPGREVEAYFIQHLSQFCIGQYERFRAALRKKRS